MVYLTGLKLSPDYSLDSHVISFGPDIAVLLELKHKMVSRIHVRCH